jgi:hypothetical protein
VFFWSKRFFFLVKFFFFISYILLKVSVKGKWNKKRSCMESELSDFEKKLNTIRQEMSEEDIISSELETR